MKIESIAIKNLFGYYTYDIHLEEQGELFIITGLNGSGKTTIMRIMDNLSQGKLHYFYELPFDSIIIKLINNQDPTGQLMKLLIEKRNVESKKKTNKGDNQPDTNVNPDQEVKFVCYIKDNGREKRVAEAVLRKNKETRKTFDYFYGDFSLRFGTLDDSASNYPNVDKVNYTIETKKVGKGMIPFTFYSSYNLKFVEAQRLLISELDKDKKQTTSKPTIKEVAEKLEEHLKDARYDFLTESQRKSNNFIMKLLTSSDEPMSEEEYNSARDELMPTVDELKTYNLASEFIIPYNEKKKGILSVYIQDQKAKLEIFSDVLRELNLFSKLLKKKKFSHKDISFSPQYGLRAYTDDGKPIDLESLSSGEQNEIIILYKLIFDVPGDMILLIDEPEISLHVIWQEEFMEDLEEISNVRKQQMIIATHSPQIIGNRWKQCYDLTEMNLNR